MIWCGRWKGRANVVDLSFAPCGVTRKMSDEAEDLFEIHKGNVRIWKGFDFLQAHDDQCQPAATSCARIDQFIWWIYFNLLFLYVLNPRNMTELFSEMGKLRLTSSFSWWKSCNFEGEKIENPWKKFLSLIFFRARNWIICKN